MNTNTESNILQFEKPKIVNPHLSALLVSVRHALDQVNDAVPDGYERGLVVGGLALAENAICEMWNN